MEVSIAATIRDATVQMVTVERFVKGTTDSICVSCSTPPEHEEQAVLCGVHGHSVCSGAQLPSPCSVGPVAACSCLNGGYFSGGRCLCRSGYGGPYCQEFVGEGK